MATKKKSAIPAAFAKNAIALSRETQDRLRGRGKELVALIVRKRQEASSLFYEIGQCLRELSKKPVYTALGHKSFQALVESELGMKIAYVTQLKLVPEKIGQNLAIDLGVAKSIAVASALELPGTSLQGYTLRFEAPKIKKALHVLKTTAKEIEVVAKLVRQKHQGPTRSRGLTTTPAERSRAESIQETLHASGASKATVKCVATKPGQPSDFVIRINAESLVVLRKTLVQIVR